MRQDKMTASEAFNLLLSGDVVTAIAMPFTDLMGGYFYALLIMLWEFLVYMKTENYATAMITGMVFSGVFILLLPLSMHRPLYVFIALGVAIILYRVVH